MDELDIKNPERCIQLSVPSVPHFVVSCLFMYVYYSEEEHDAEIHGRQLSWSGPVRTTRRARRAWMVLLAVCGSAFAVLLVSATILNRFDGAAQTWADTLGVAVAALACVQWIPQIITTWQLQDLGSLSLLSLLLMTPYTWIFGINMILRVGFAGWSVWTVYVLVGTMQLVLIVMGIIFAIRNYKSPPSDPHDDRATLATLQYNFGGWNPNGSKRSFASSQIAPDDRRPLLADGNRSSDHLSVDGIQPQSP
ncbi:hypothetical protein TruAng_008205 [Truncatella angustata]|nr:hypothetical protein TruAng_008205 [Truncatella angustata]